MKRSNLGPGIVKRLVSSGRPQGGAAGVLRLEEASRLLVVRQKQEGPFKYSGNEKKIRTRELLNGKQEGPGFSGGRSVLLMLRLLPLWIPRKIFARGSDASEDHKHAALEDKANFHYLKTIGLCTKI
ncbi:hypothetical protein M8J77_010981 [Diaphorina citri]|nr:hypothetical protein M8J77_010981 [Diaphorina citri]